MGETPRTWRTVAVRIVEAVPLLRRNLLASCDYELLPEGADPAGGDLAGASQSGWASRRTVRRQERAWSRLTANAVAGEAREDIQAVLDCVESAPPCASLLEVGCGSGYFSDIIHGTRPDIAYTGVDFSAAMIEMARRRRAFGDFTAGDAADLPFSDGAFDMVVDGAALIHIPRWRQALAEYSRIADGSVVLSSLTVAEIPTTRLVRKRAYGAPVVELVFSRSQLEDELAKAGRWVADRTVTLPYDLQRHIGIHTTSETWTCTRKP